MRKVWLILGALALALPAATAAAPPKPPVFNVTIRATMDETRNWEDDVQGCLESVTRHIEIENAKPFTLSASQLGHAKGNLFALVATETRSITFTASKANACVGWPNGGQSADCGTVTDSIPASGTGLGFLSLKTDKFGFGYTRIGTDPYHGNCGLIANPGQTTIIDHYPAGLGLPTLTTVAVNRTKLTTHKAFAVTYSGSGQWSDGGLSNGSPQPPSQVAVSWQVKLVPVPLFRAVRQVALRRRWGNAACASVLSPEVFSGQTGKVRRTRVPRWPRLTSTSPARARMSGKPRPTSSPSRVPA